MFGFSRGVLGFALSVLLGLGTSALAANAKGIEVFTVRDQPISRAGSPQLRSLTVRVFEIDGLQRIESALSRDLPSAPDMARAEALRRIGDLNDGQVAYWRDAAVGMARAHQYGIDRYPAIVIDRATVIYGVSDLAQALNRYEAWRKAQWP